MDLTYTQALPEDIQLILNQSRELITAYEDLASIDLLKVLSWMQRKIETNIDDYTCVWKAGEKVAFYCLREEPDAVELDDLYVLPNFRNRGIGTKILSRCVANMDRPIYLYVFTGNAGAIRLYRRFGFAKTSQVSATRCIMTKQP